MCGFSLKYPFLLCMLVVSSSFRYRISGKCLRICDIIFGGGSWFFFWLWVSVCCVRRLFCSSMTIGNILEVKFHNTSGIMVISELLSNSWSTGVILRHARPSRRLSNRGREHGVTGVTLGMKWPQKNEALLSSQCQRVR